MKKLLTLVILLSVTLLAACSTNTPRTMESLNMSAALKADESVAWRSCTFRVAWPEQTEPNWGVDLLLAHRVVGPVLEKFDNDIHRWRFHRRANRDAAGHQFTFMFYTGTSHARDIIAQIEQDELRQQLLEENLLEVAACDSPEDMLRPLISDTSDSNWPDSVQKHWPSYIMGVSSLWLGLIDEAVASVRTETSDIDQLIQQYNNANQTVTSLWQEYGEHAFLHHLNAIFGYEQLLIRY